MGTRDDGIRGAAVALVERGCSACLVGEPGIGRTEALLAVLRSVGRPAIVGGGLRLLRDLPRSALERAIRERVPVHRRELVATVERRVGDGVLALDDLQWVDDETLALLPELARRFPVLVTVRLGEACADVALAAAGAAGAQVLPLPGLDDADAADLVRGLRADLSEDEVQRLVAGAGGNPTAIRQLASDGRLDAGFEHALGRCVGHASPEGLRAVALAGLSPRPLPIASVPGAEAALAAGLLASHEGHVRVRHDAVGEAALAMLDPGDIAVLRRELAASLSDPVDRAEQLAAAGDVDAAADLARQAVAVASDPSDVARLSEVLASCTSGLESAVAWLDAAEAHLAIGGPRAAARTLDAVNGSAPTSRRSALVAHVAAVRADAGVDQLATAVLGDPSATADDRARAEAARSLARAWPAWQPEQAVEAAARAVEAASDPAVGESARRLVALASVASALVSGARGWRRGAEQAGREGVVAVAWGSLLEGRPGSPAAPSPLFDAVHGLLAVGDGDRSAARLRPLVAEGGGGISSEVAAAHLAVALADSGRTGAAADVVAGARAGGTTVAGGGVLAWAMAEVELAAGRLSRCRRAAAEAVAAVEAPFPAAPLAALAGAWAAALSADLNGSDAAGEWPSPPASPWPGPATATVEAAALEASRAGDHRTAAALFAEAAAGWAGWHRRGELRCRWAGAAALGKAGDVGAAVDALRGVEAEAAAVGQRPLVARARRSLRTLGHRAAGPRVVGGRGPLSGREVEVLELVAAGYTTAEAAQLTGVAPSTVESQVDSAMRKLGARSRFQAAAMVGGLT